MKKQQKSTMIVLKPKIFTTPHLLPSLTNSREDLFYWGKPFSLKLPLVNLVDPNDRTFLRQHGWVYRVDNRNFHTKAKHNNVKPQACSNM